jgi:hypothetical protein
MQQEKRGVAYAVRPEELKRRKFEQPAELIGDRQFCTAVLKEGPERGKLKNLQC